jgi:hypothetical protein
MFDFKQKDKEEKDYLTSIGFDDKTGLTQKDRDNGFNAVDEDGIPYFSKSRAKETATTSPTETSTGTYCRRNTNITSFSPVAPGICASRIFIIER